jgi:tRNA-specific 2-thiouridylase
VRCNERIKFSALLDKALALDFDAVCTGHYARLEPGPELHRAVDHGKDQSYVLAVLTPERLGHALFPLGDTLKADVRREAADRGLQLAAKPDSHDICFVADGDTKTWLGARLGRRPGPVVDTAGEVVGEHDGAYAYTVGQRHGLRLGRPAPDGAPRYVLEVRPADDTVVVGPRQELDADSIEATGATWCGPEPAVGERVGVQVRAHGEELPGTIEALDADGVRLRLDRPVRAAAPGQTAALYAGSRVVGSATITRAAARAGTGR